MGLDLNGIAWHETYGAYGPVTDLPRHIGALSASRGMRENSVQWLCDNLIHQGTRWPATSLAMPFLLEVAADPRTPYREDILQMVKQGVGTDRETILNASQTTRR